jgi:polysaccharide deacetylase family protein (PEP-CTERM system associated)
MINSLSIDLEYWWSIELLKGHVPDRKNDLVYESAQPLLNLLDKYNTKATFFVLGMLAEKYPELIEDIYHKGHEIASHAYSHRTLYDLGELGFEEEIIKSKMILDKYDPIGFRAPSFSIDNETRWAFKILKKCGFKYDSSIFPIKTMLYGVPGAPIHIYRPSEEDVSQHDPNGGITEFPLTVINIGGLNIPVSGGFYLRILPLRLLKLCLLQVNKERPAIIYIHPWEMYSGIPHVNISPLSRFITYHGINNALAKLESLLIEFKFNTIRDALYEV